MRLVYFGSPPEATVSLRALVGAGHDVVLVVTQPDRRRGRGSATEPSSVKKVALELDLPVVTPAKSGEIVEQVAGLGADLGVVVAFGQLLPQRLLDAIPGGFVNVHFSLLPRWRGAAPVERAILAGDAETGACLMRLEAGLDTGPVYACARTPIADDDTAGTLRARLTDLGTELLVQQLPRIVSNEPAAQSGEPTYAAKLDVEEFAIDWNESAAVLARVVRAANPKPGAWTLARGKRLKILMARPAAGSCEPGSLTGIRVGTGDGVLVLDEVQPEGRARMPAAAWIAGVRDLERLGS